MPNCGNIFAQECKDDSHPMTCTVLKLRLEMVDKNKAEIIKIINNIGFCLP